MSKKSLFITPPYHCGVVESAGRWPNLGFLYIAGELRKDGHSVEIYDAMAKNHSWEHIEQRIRSSQPDIVGSTAYTATIIDALEVLRLAKRMDPNIITIIGGIHPTMMPEETLAMGDGALDYVIRWEGEFTTPELIRALACGGDLDDVPNIAYRKNGAAVTTSRAGYIENLDALEPAWDLIDWQDYYLCYMDDSRVATIATSRGCTNECLFCSQQRFWEKTFRARSAENVVAEMEFLNTRYGVNVFFIGDEFPTKDRERWEKILDLLIHKDMHAHLLIETCTGDILRDRDILWKYRRAGVIHLYLGVEAGNQETLDQFKKTQTCHECREAIGLLNSQGIITECSFIRGLPDETPDTIRQTLEIARHYNADNPHFLMISPWPYSDMYDKLKPYIEDYDYRNYNLVAPVVKPKHMTRDEVFREVLWCYKTYYMKKLSDWDGLQDTFKQELLFRGLKAIMENSFLKTHMGSMGEMPEEVTKHFHRFAAGT